MAQQPPAGPKTAPDNDLYTVLLIGASALLLVGVIYLAIRSSHLLGSIWPPSGA